MFRHSAPIFPTRDLDGTLAFYRDVLGFANVWRYGEPPTFGGASSEGYEMLFSLADADPAPRAHFLRAEDVDHLYALHLERGAPITSPLEAKPWGMREYTVLDPNGVTLRIGGDMDVRAERSSVDRPVGARAERRLPTVEEYFWIYGWDRATHDVGTVRATLERTWRGVVVMPPESAPGSPGRAVGMIRIMHDGPGWVSVWDVAVHPDWQGLRLGALLMEETMALLHEEVPGANVCLFTYKPGFYEKFGFGKSTAMMRTA